MRHGDKAKKLGRTAQHRKALMRNLVTALLEHERITTTLAKAKEARRYADRVVAQSLGNTVAARREVGRFVSDKTVLKKLFDVIAPRFAGRPGGFTRVLRLGPREGDAAEMAMLELVIREERHHEKKARAAVEKQRGGRKTKPDKKADDKSKARDESEE
ncbi:MAG TPA: 50S ribosomal protein L17 [bacterium]|nr:50S ribosomal protein L17 [bacterium]